MRGELHLLIMRKSMLKKKKKVEVFVEEDLVYPSELCWG